MSKNDPLDPAMAARIRWARICVRSLHIVAICGLAGGVFWGVDSEQLRPWWMGTALSGLLLAATFSAGGLGWLVELRGLSLLLKLGLLGGVLLLPQAAAGVLVAVILLAGVTSHMPGRYRYRVPWRAPEDP